MAKYRTRPVFIDAVRFDPNSSPWPEGIVAWEGLVPRDMSFGYMATPEGMMHVWAGDYIVTDAKGNKRPYRPDAFRALFGEASTGETVLQPEEGEWFRKPGPLYISSPRIGGICQTCLGAISLEVVMLKGIYAVVVDGIDEAMADMLQARLNRWAGREQFCVLPVPKDTMVYFDRIEEQEVADTAARHPVYNVYGTINYPDSMERAVEP